MKRKLEIEINCGEKTCASEPGNFCEFVGTKSFGQIFICCLFPKYSVGAYTKLSEKDGWLLRCDECLKSEKIKEE